MPRCRAGLLSRSVRTGLERGPETPLVTERARRFHPHTPTVPATARGINPNGLGNPLRPGRQNCSFAKRPRVAHMFNDGWSRLAVGGWWRLAVGGWWLVAVGGGWRRIDGWWGLVVGGWWLAAVGSGWWLAVGGGWQLAVGGWWVVAVGIWRLVVPGDGPQGRSLAKKGGGSLRTPPAPTAQPPASGTPIRCPFASNPCPTQYRRPCPLSTPSRAWELAVMALPCCTTGG